MIYDANPSASGWINIKNWDGGEGGEGECALVCGLPFPRKVVTSEAESDFFPRLYLPTGIGTQNSVSGCERSSVLREATLKACNRNAIQGTDKKVAFCFQWGRKSKPRFLHAPEPFIAINTGLGEQQMKRTQNIGKKLYN